MERCKSAPKLGSIEESPEQEEVEEKDWLRVLALRKTGAIASPATSRPPVPAAVNNSSPVHATNGHSKHGAVSLETVREEDRCLAGGSKMGLSECDPSPDAVSPDGLLVSATSGGSVT